MDGTVSDRELPEYYQLRDKVYSLQDCWEIPQFSNKSDSEQGELLSSIDLFAQAKICIKPDSMEWHLYYTKDYPDLKKYPDCRKDYSPTDKDFGDFIAERWKDVSIIEDSAFTFYPRIDFNPFKRIVLSHAKPVMYSTFRDCWKIITEHKDDLKRLLFKRNTNQVASPGINSDEPNFIPVGLWDDLGKQFFVHKELSEGDFITWVNSQNDRKRKEDAKKKGYMSNLSPIEMEQTKHKFRFYNFTEAWVKQYYRECSRYKEKLPQNLDNHKLEQKISRALNADLKNATGYLTYLQNTE
jgi:hypothetical protein